MTLHRSSFKKLPTSIPMFEKIDTSLKKSLPKSKYSPVVEVKHNGRVLFINKTTVVWLLQESERVSTNRLLRVRSNQPYNNTTSQLPVHNETSSTVPVIQQLIEVCNICVFQDPESITKWRIGKLLQFCNYLEKTKHSQQYHGTSADPSTKPEKLGVLCTWFTPTMSTATFRVCDHEDDYIFIPATSYVCTLTHGCFKSVECCEDNDIITSTVTHLDSNQVNLATAHCFTLTEEFG